MAARNAECHPEQPYFAHGMCNSCYRREWRRKNPLTPDARERAKQTARRWYKANKERASTRNAANRYGISPDEVIELRKRSCQTCGSDNDIHIDHDHETDVVRGCLCRTCNLLVGHVEMHDKTKQLEILQNIASYLKLGRLNGK